MCSNHWGEKWIPSNCLGEKSARNKADKRLIKKWPPFKGEGLPPLEERKKVGCPNHLRVKVEVENDVLKRVFFSNNLDEVILGDW